MVYVVGNSLHGQPGASSDRAFVIAADILMAAIAELVGMQVRQVIVTRRPHRRRANSEFLRESVVVLDVPAT